MHIRRPASRSTPSTGSLLLYDWPTRHAAAACVGDELLPTTHRRPPPGPAHPGYTFLLQSQLQQSAGTHSHYFAAWQMTSVIFTYAKI